MISQFSHSQNVLVLASSSSSSSLSTISQPQPWSFFSPLATSQPQGLADCRPYSLEIVKFSTVLLEDTTRVRGLNTSAKCLNVNVIWAKRAATKLPTCVSQCSGEKNLVQDVQTKKSWQNGLPWPPIEADVGECRRSVSVLEIRRIQGKARSSFRKLKPEGRRACAGGWRQHPRGRWRLAPLQRDRGGAFFLCFPFTSFR